MDDVVVRIAKTERSDLDGAVAELAERLALPGAVFHLVFASPRFDPEGLASGLSARLPAPVLGCTTAGELSPGGFSSGSIVGLSLASPRVRLAHELVHPLEGASFGDLRRSVERVLAQLGDIRRPVYGLALVDGLGEREESFIAAVAAAAPQVRWVGGSAADIDFSVAYIFHQGHAYPDAALLMVLETDLPVHVIKSEHMLPTGSKTVVTAASPVGRRVFELDGKPAVARYAQLLGIAPSELTRELAGMRPFACRVAGVPYVRSVSGIEEGALRFACAIAPGAVLELMTPGDLVESTAETLNAAREAVGGELAAVIAFNCLGRFLEAQQRGLVDQLGAAYAAHPVIGFNTYGEQCDGLHVNHTFTGLAVGRRRSA